MPIQLLGFLFIFLLFFLPPIDTDLGWHLRYGEHFLQTGDIWKTNELTYFLEGYYFPYTAAFYQVITALVGGLFGLSLVYAILMTLAFLAYSRINKSLLKINLLGFLFIAFFGWVVFSLGWRSQIFTFFGLITTFWILSKTERSPKLGFLLPLLFFVWANTHGGFILGLAILSFATFQELVNKNWQKFKYLAVLTITSGLAALLNPFGVDIYKEALRHSQYPLKTLIAEWVPPSLEFKLLIIGIGVFALVALWAKGEKKVFWSLVLLFFSYLAFDARRHLPFFALVTVLALKDSFKEKLALLEIKPLFAKLFTFGILLGILLLFVTRIPRTMNIAFDPKTYCSVLNYPCRAIEFIRANPQDKNVFTAYEWGGFLEWQLPEYKPFVDGRMPAWDTPEGKSPYTVYLEIIQAQPGYQETLDKYGTDWLLIGIGTFLDIELQNKPEDIWEEIYRDKVSTVYTR